MAIAGVCRVTGRAQAAAPASDDGVTAVIVEEAGEGWLGALAGAVETGRLTVPRVSLEGVTAGQVTVWARSALAALEAPLRYALMADLLDLVERVCELGGIRRVLVRAFTEAPTGRCGFHVDTVAPQAPPFGALRVYNGACTEYVEPEDVEDVRRFYAYLSRRERLARGGGEVPPVMDACPDFVRAGAAIRAVPPGAVVFFRHLDVRRHWSEHPPRAAWIHRSPMAGGPRLVVNVSPAERRRRPG
ncbi:DUF1826 domain-containing protein [Nonomuraea sp. FMUSA5-5]|uniref:DUF1826 domain-containing protein n=1 Tax=Nonomuraea composti TaxID=2720023 RepID=A0ABX1AT85_9ACTN|nr:DUF1826 domain-containing protein [Nonomuraea sp. FMUSA5-5]NJP88839.1 DUF1826 domain-containing protein [Nonomuraea sp. FMUSA5-5]